MIGGFSAEPHKEALALLASKQPVASTVFYGMLPELRGRAFTVSGVESATVLQRCRDAIAALPRGMGEDGEKVSWDTQKRELVEELEPYLGEDGAQARAQLLLRVNTFQVWSASIWRVAQADDNTTHLQYIHGDQAKDPTPSHVALDGIVLPKDDVFWDTHTGPWGHLGCVCYMRPMDEDMVADARQLDREELAAGGAKEDTNVLDAERIKRLHDGEITRNGRRFWVANDGPGAFHWGPDDLRLPLGELKLRYDPEVWEGFERLARRTMVMPKTMLWNWLSNLPGERGDAGERARNSQRLIDKVQTPP